VKINDLRGCAENACESSFTALLFVSTICEGKTVNFLTMPPLYIGKESDKHWEEGEDFSLLEFKTIEYKRKGCAIATDEQLERIARVPKREFMRRGINQHTLGKICKRAPVRASKLATVLKALQQ
jgi:hypothetical protein